MRYKRLRRCLNPNCLHTVSGGKMTLESTWVKEYVRLTCQKCGAISVFNPIGRVSPDLRRHIYVQRGRGPIEHVFPKSRVLIP